MAWSKVGGHLRALPFSLFLFLLATFPRGPRPPPPAHKSPGSARPKSGTAHPGSPLVQPSPFVLLGAKRTGLWKGGAAALCSALGNRVLGAARGAGSDPERGAAGEAARRGGQRRRATSPGAEAGSAPPRAPHAPRLSRRAGGRLGAPAGSPCPGGKSRAPELRGRTPGHRSGRGRREQEDALAQAGVLLRLAARRPGGGGCVPAAVSPEGSLWPDRGDTLKPRGRGDGAWRGRCREDRNWYYRPRLQLGT